MKVFCTGISGSNREKYLEDVLDYSKKLNTPLNFYSVGEYFKKNVKKYFGNYDEDKVLNIPFSNRAPIIGESFEEILNDIREKKAENVILSCHGSFYWNKLIERAFLWEKINKINPDMFITLINHAPTIQQKLKQRDQWKSQNLTSDEISLWQNIEVNETEGIANIRGKPSYILSSNESPILLYKLMLHPEYDLVYSSFPMTNVAEDAKKVDDFVLRLYDYFSVLNPKSIEIGKKTTEIIERQTVKRDLSWYIGKAKRTVVFFPKKIFSAGAISEVKETHDIGKEVWWIMPSKKLGPFEKNYASKIFFSTNEFFKFADSYLMEKGLKKWSEKEKELMKKRI